MFKLSDIGAIKQVFYRYGSLNTTDNYIYERTYHAGSSTWSDWEQIVTKGDLDPLPAKKMIVNKNSGTETSIKLKIIYGSTFRASILMIGNHASGQGFVGLIEIKNSNNISINPIFGNIDTITVSMDSNVLTIDGLNNYYTATFISTKEIQ